MVQILILIATILSSSMTTQLKAETPVTVKLIDGSRVGSFEHPQVAKLSLNGAGLCTGTLIAPDALITAAHCFFDDRNLRVVGDTDVIANFPSASIRSSQVFINPNYVPRNEACIEGETDIAIVKLESTLSGVEPAKISSSAPFVGSVIKLVGYGSEGDATFGMNGALPPTGFVNQGFTSIETISTSYLQWIFNRGETNTAGGDSGGPAFSTSNHNTITSITCGGGGNAEAGTDSLNTRLDTSISWIISIIPGLQVSLPEPLTITGSTFIVGDEVVIPIVVGSNQNANLVFDSLPSGFSFDGKFLKGSIQQPGVYRISTRSENAYGSSLGFVEFTVLEALPFDGKAKGSVSLKEVNNSAEKITLDIPIKLAKGMKINGARIAVTVFGVRKTFRLDRDGFSLLNDRSSLQLVSKSTNGKLTRSAVKIHVVLRKIPVLSGFSISNALAGNGAPALSVKISTTGLTFKGNVSAKYSRAK